MPVETVDIHEFNRLRRELPVADVRSPAEFSRAHVPGALSLPLFTNEQRAEVGTLYTQHSRERALERGLELVGPRLLYFYKRALTIAPGRELLMYCWRGGMRSSSMASFLGPLGFKIYVLENGYKAYRQHVIETFKKNYNLVVLGGMTGSGKTETLLEMKKLGAAVIDLEGLANHRGSAFGALGRQPETEHFENLLSEELNHFTDSESVQAIWVEDESRLIGRVYLPPDFRAQMQNAPLLCAQIPVKKRIRFLLDTYDFSDKEQLLNSLQKIHKRLGGLRYKAAVSAVKEERFATAIEQVLDYYDRAYGEGLDKRDKLKIQSVTFEEVAPGNNARKLLESVSQLPHLNHE